MIKAPIKEFINKFDKFVGDSKIDNNIVIKDDVKNEDNKTYLIDNVSDKKNIHDRKNKKNKKIKDKKKNKIIDRLIRKTAKFHYK